MMKSGSKAQAGFTLVELIIVIVILGILAVTAAPRFLNLQDDAQVSAMQGVQGALEGSLAIVNGKAIIAGVHNTAKTATTPPVVEGINLQFGYPVATVAAMQAAMNIDLTNDFASSIITVTSANDTLVIRSLGSTAPTAPVAGNGTGGQANDGCYVAYTEASGAGATPTIITNFDDC